jgi:hypothetical protein
MTMSFEEKAYGWRGFNMGGGSVGRPLSSGTMMSV